MSRTPDFRHYDLPSDTGGERAAAKEFLHEQRSIYTDRPDSAVNVWTELCQMLLASNAFLYVD